jgi:hypothetical protein
MASEAGRERGPRRPGTHPRHRFWTDSLNRRAFLPALVGLLELFVAVLITGISAVNAAVPTGAFRRLRDGRFLLLAAANAGLAVLGAYWTWGQLPLGAPSWAASNLPTLTGILLVTVLLLATTLWPRHA